MRLAGGFERVKALVEAVGDVDAQTRCGATRLHRGLAFALSAAERRLSNVAIDYVRDEMNHPERRRLLGLACIG